MNHPFIQSSVPDVCSRCRRAELDHTDLAICEGCPNVGLCEVYAGTILLCPTCTQKELDHQSPEKQAERLAQMREATLQTSKEIDNSITTRADYFNAETISISELKSVIDADPSIARKDYALYEVVHARYVQFKKVLIEIEDKRLEVSNNIKADQVYLNSLVSSLTKEEQDKYKARDIEYKPNEVKVVKPRSATPSASMSELKQMASEHNIEITILTMLCKAHKLTPLKAVHKYKEMLSSVVSK